MTDQHPLTDAFLQSYYRYGDGPYDEDQMRDTYDLGESKGRAEMLEQVVEWLRDNLQDHRYSGIGIDVDYVIEALAQDCAPPPRRRTTNG